MTSHREQDQETTDDSEPAAPPAAVDGFIGLIVPQADVPEEERPAGSAPRTTGD